MTQVTIRTMAPDEWHQVAHIYTAGIATGNANLETEPPSWDHWDTTHRADLRLLATHPHQQVIGWAAAGNVSDRCCLHRRGRTLRLRPPAHHGHGVGRQLLTALIDTATAAGIWTIQTGIFPENQASVALHQGCGFRIIGTRERIGQLHGTWREVLFLEYRAPHP